MTPLDKEVDVYCAWIDHADQINTKSKKQTLGFNGNKKDSDSDDEFAGQEKKIAKLQQVQGLPNNVFMDSATQYEAQPVMRFS